MAWTDESWLHNALHAMKQTFDVDTRTRNEMIQFLLDEGFWSTETLKTWAAAEARWNACLNPNKSEFFKVGEVWALMSRFSRHQLFEAMARDLGYEVRRIPTEERRHQLLEQIASAATGFEALMTSANAELARLSVPTTAPPPRAPGGPVHFSLMDDAQSAPSLVDRVGCP